MAFELRRVVRKCYTLCFRRDAIGCVFYRDDHPEPWVAMLYKSKFRDPLFFPHPFVDREHSFETLAELRDWLNRYHPPIGNISSHMVFE